MTDDNPTNIPATPPPASAGDCHHGWRGASEHEPIRDPCPACGGQVFIGEGGHLTCSSLHCPNPDVADAWDTKFAAAEAERDELRDWVNDLQAGMYINCVYCGHRYGPDDEVASTMQEVLKEHVEQCPEHPMSTLKAREQALREALGDYGAHQRGCVLGCWEAGRPTELDGYQTKYRGTWYDADDWPECECGLNAAIGPE